MLADFIVIAQPTIDKELQRVVTKALFKSYPGIEDILRYQLGWESQSGQGKRIRPVMVLLSAGATGANWRCALPAAAAVELLHNFSLIHDDIEDNSQFRRGQHTVWKKWGIPLAINAGDAMFALAFDAISRLSETVDLQAAQRSTMLLAETSLQLTCGQHMDIAFEQERQMGMDAYWAMIAGKTAALLSASMRFGAIAGKAGAEQEQQLASFGHYLGLAFQAWDDWLGIWGDPNELGKSTESDLVAGKKTLPVVFALEQRGRFAERWMRGSILPEEVGVLSGWLIDEGAQAFVENQTQQLTEKALQSLQTAGCDNEYTDNLHELALSLLKRRR